MQQLDDIAVNILEQAVKGDVLTEEEADCSVDLWLNSGEESSWTDYYIEQGILSRHFKVRLNMICKGVLPSSHVQNCFLQNGLQTLMSEIKSWRDHREIINSTEGTAMHDSHRSHSDAVFDDMFDPKPGMTIENFLLTRNIGAGAAGAVFEAVDLSTNETVALKIFKKRNPSQNYKASPLGGQNFIEEAQLLCWLDHENIVKSLDYIHGDLCALVMEYIPGFTLQQLIDQGGRIPVHKCCRILLKILKALAYVHEHKLIHRDIKPANILLSTEGVIKLTDLGIAKITNDLNSLDSKKPKQLVGTPYYIAPEQIFSPESADARSDIYSFGATFYHAITGQTPYTAKNSQQMINMHICGKLTPPHHVCRDIPVELSNIIVNMMHKVPDERYDSVQEVIDAIEGVVEQLNTPTTETQTIVLEEIYEKVGEKNKTILIVSGDSEFAQSMERDIHANGYDVVLSESAETVLKKPDLNLIDLIVADLTLPGKNGIELLRKLKGNKHTGQIPVMIMSDPKDEQMVNNVISKGVDFVAKPIEPNDLLQKIRDAIGRPLDEKTEPSSSGSQGILRHEDDYFNYLISGNNEQQLIKSYKFENDHSWQRDTAIKETYFHSILSHKNIMHVVDFRLSSKEVELIYPWDSYDFIGDLLEKDFIFYPEALWEVAGELATGLEFLHQHGISHGNLNPYSILVNSRNVKLFDFSQAVDHHSPDVEAFQAGVELNPFFHKENNDMPERSFAQDIFCLGQVLTACSLSGYRKDLTQIIKTMSVDLLEDNERGLDDSFISLVKLMMHDNPEERPKASDLLEELL